MGDGHGKKYYYNGIQVQWERPTEAAIPAPPPKPLTNEEKLQQIINECIKTTQTPQAIQSTETTPVPVETPKKKEETWRTMSLEKQKKIYENTLYHAIKPTIDKFKPKISRKALSSLTTSTSESVTRTKWNASTRTLPGSTLPDTSTKQYSRWWRRRRETTKRERKLLLRERQRHLLSSAPLPRQWLNLNLWKSMRRYKSPTMTWRMQWTSSLQPNASAIAKALPLRLNQKVVRRS